MTSNKAFILISTTWIAFIFSRTAVSLRVYELLGGLHFDFAEAVQIILINPSYDDIQELQVNKNFQSLQLQVLTDDVEKIDNRDNMFCSACGRDYLIVSCHNNIFEIKAFLSNISEITFKWTPTVFAVLSTKSEISHLQLKQEFSSVAMKIQFDRNIIIAVDDDSKDGFILYELYRIVTTTIVQKIRTVAENEYTMETIYSQNRRYNLHGDVIRSAFYEYKRPRIQGSSKMTTAHLNQMSTLLNFSIKNVMSDGWISFAANASKRGIGCLLENNEAEFSPQYSEISIDRIKKLHFIFPFSYHREEAFFLQPPTMFENILLQPFKVKLWIVFGISFFILVMLSFTMKEHLFLCPKKRERDKVQNNLGNLLESILWVVSLFTQQGWYENPSRFPYKLLTISGLALTTSAYFTYSASVLSIITAREPPIKTFDALLKSGMDILVDSDSPGVYRYVKGGQQDKVLSSYEGLTRILTTPSAFLTYEEYLTTEGMEANIQYKEVCKTISKVSLNSKGLPVVNGMYTKKNSPYRKIFRYACVRMGEAGFILRAKRFLRRNFTTCVTHDKSVMSTDHVDLEPLTFSVLAPLFVMLFATGIICLIILGLEIRSKHDRKMKYFWTSSPCGNFDENIRLSII